MTSATVWLTLLAPLALVGAGLLATGTGRTATVAACRRALAGSLVALAVAIAGAATVGVVGAYRTETLGVAGVGFAVYVDALTATMLVLVAFIGAVVLRYSRNYLDGDPRQAYFVRWLCFALAAVLVLIGSGNLLLTALAWIATSVALNQLLQFYRERPGAVLAARKKFVVSRLGDLCLLTASILLYRSFGSLDYAQLLAAARDLHASGGESGAVHVAALFLAAAALLKCAQFPLHGWLLEVMETPTPVSALLHAGIINAGGFVVLRFADLIVLSPAALDTLAIVGACTALFGSVVMPTQTSIKVALAYSTIAQMGFMMLQCGLGAFSSALLHIVAHSLYKAHAFLSSGSVIDLARASWNPSRGSRTHAPQLVLVLASLSMLALAALVALALDVSLADNPGPFALGLILMLGLFHLLANAAGGRPSSYVAGRAVLLSLMVGAGYFALQFAAARLFAGSLPSMPAARGPFGLALAVLAVVCFALIVMLQNAPARIDSPRWHALYVHLANGLYVNTIVNRFVLRLWPARAGSHRYDGGR